MARARGLPLQTPSTLKNHIITEEADVAVVAAYGLMLPQRVLDRFPCINIHPSLLPRWRGAAPIERAIMAGDDKTGVCIMKMDAGLDTGPIFCREELAISPQDTGGTLTERLANIACRLLLGTLQRLTSGAALVVSQEEDGVTYAHKITKDDELIHWANDGQTIERQIRALSPNPCAYFMSDDERIKVVEASFEFAEHGLEPGTIIRDEGALRVTVAGGFILPTVVQRAGGKRMMARDFLRGWRMGK
jgi:methionyl-tRNA formyltransferase